MVLDAYLAELSRQGQLNGSVLVRHKGETLLDRGYGVADRAHGRPNTPETAFQIASISKQFAAAAILLLQELGALSVQNRIPAWVPGCPTEWESITVHHLLTHTSGIGHWSNLPELNLFEPKPWENLLSIFQRHPLKFAPGQGWAYSGPGYVLLAHIVEQVSGQPYAQFLHQRIFHPLGMSSTGAGNQAPRPDQQAVGYTGETLVPSFELETVDIGAGDMWSTSRDLALWDAALATPALLSAASLQAMFAPHAAVADDFAAKVFDGIPGIQYGYGWFIAEVEGCHLRIHPGDQPGFIAVNATLPTEDAVIIVLSNDQQNNVGEITFRLLGALLGAPDSVISRDP